MTTTVTVQSHNYPVLVTQLDRYWDPETKKMTNIWVETSSEVLWPKDGQRLFYCTTSREVRAVDLEYDDPRVNVRPE